MFASTTTHDFNALVPGFTLIAAVITALGAVKLILYLRRAREQARAQARWIEFPGKRGLALSASTPRGAMYEGTVNGMRVMLRRGAEHAPQDDRKLKPPGPGYVCIAAQCTRPQPAGLQLWRENERDAARKETRKLNEVIIGNMELDAALIIRGKQAAEIRALLCQPEVKQAVLEFFKQWPESIVTDYWVKCEADALAKNARPPEDMLEAALSVAKALDNAKH